MVMILRQHSKQNYPVMNVINIMSMDLYRKGCDIVVISLTGKNSLGEEIQHEHKITVDVKEGKLS